jgi:hypothetical protein
MDTKHMHIHECLYAASALNSICLYDQRNISGSLLNVCTEFMMYDFQ